MSEPSMMVNKVTLSSGKVVLLKEMKIKYQNLAIQAVGKKAGDNTSMMAILMQQEIIKQLVVQIDGRNVSAKDLESLDEVFSYADYSQLTKVVGQLMGGTDQGELPTEFVSIGGV